MTTKKKAFIFLPLLFVLLGGGYLGTQGPAVDEGNLPKFMTTNFIDEASITSISKFRSAAGHDFSAGDESCRSMKHYFSPNITAENRAYMESSQGVPRPPDGTTDINVYSPVNGTVTQVASEQFPVGKQVYIVPDEASNYTIRIFHVWVNSEIEGGTFGLGGTKVTAGQKIGVIAAGQTTDVAVEVGKMPWQKAYVSAFEVMTPEVVAEWQARGLGSVSDVIISPEARAANPLECTGERGEEFVRPAGYDDQSDYLPLHGYIDEKASYKDEPQRNI